MKTTFLPLVALLAASAHALAAPVCEARSGDHRVALLELYTSEGCSSCPPADAWVSSLDRRGLRSDRVIPLALHVDYWDRLGWRDRFASPRHTARQEWLAHHGSSATLYTPEVFLNGREWRHAGDSERLRTAVTAATEPPRALIALSRGADGQVTVRADMVAADHGRAQLFVAFAENGHASAVQAGENQGRTLRHDHVVRNLAGPYPADGKDVTLPYPAVADAASERHPIEVVAFVQLPDTGEVLQAVALAPCP